MEKLYDAEKLQIFIHFFGVVFFDGLLDVQDLNLYGLGSETDLQNMRRGGSGGLPLIVTLPASQASLATVRRLMRRDTFKNLSKRIIQFLLLRKIGGLQRRSPPI